jgi:hypothetical protein
MPPSFCLAPSLQSYTSYFLFLFFFVFFSNLDAPFGFTPLAQSLDSAKFFHTVFLIIKPGFV